MIGFGRAAASCTFCGRETPPEELHELVAPFLAEGRHRVCRACRDDFAGDVPDLAAFDPGFRGDTTFRWVGPMAEDGRFLLRQIVLPPPTGDAVALLTATLGGGGAQTLGRWRELVESDPSPVHLAGGLAAALAAGTEFLPLDRVQRLVSRLRPSAPAGLELLAGVHAHAAAAVTLSHAAGPELARTQSRLLEEAKNAYLLHGPRLDSALDARVAALLLSLRLAEGRFADAKAAVERLRRDVDQRPALRDPRIPMLHALVHLHEGNLAGADRALATSLAWLEAHADRPAWVEVESALLHDLAARAFASLRWKDARDWLKRYCRLNPNDRRALLDLGHSHAKCSERAVAREVLESALGTEARTDLERLRASDPEDEDGVLLYATCLARLGDVRAAFVALEEDLARPRVRESLRAQRCHLAALCAFALAKRGEALELVVESFDLHASRRTAEDLVRVLRPRVEDLIEELAPENLEALAAILREHSAAIRQRYGVPHLIALLWFLARELGQDFKSLSGFGLGDPAITARFPADQITTFQAYVLLAQRKLVDAVRKDHEARAGGGAPIPFRVVLAFLARVRTWDAGNRKALGAMIEGLLQALT